MGLIKSFKCIILYMGSLLSWGMHFFSHRCRFITSTDANGNHMFLLQLGHRKLHKSFYPQDKLEMASLRMIECMYWKVPQSKEGLAVCWRECCAAEARGDLG